jgi:hypothetical protein
VAHDTLDETELTDVVDKRLKNGTMTLNEARDRFGEKRFGAWADEPVILGNEGDFKILGPGSFIDPQEAREQQQELEEKKIGAKSDDEGDKGGDKKGDKVEKSVARPLYVSRPVVNAEKVIAWAKSQGFGETLRPEDLHVTIAFSTSPMDWSRVQGDGAPLTVEGGARSVERLGEEGAVVLRFESLPLTQRWGGFLAQGASWDFDGYVPHITITYDGSHVDLSKVEPYHGDIVFGPEQMGEIVEDWVGGVKEKTIRKAVITPGYRTWMDDFGYSQPFIYQDIMTGAGVVVKPPVAVNLMSQELEVELSQRISAKGVNVPMVRKMTFKQVVDSMPPEVVAQFEQYINLGVGYDSEKWKGKIGASRKYAYYLVQNYLDGYKLTNQLLLNDMRRDPDSYKRAVKDLAALWLVERDMVLGDRRIDQYLITRDKRAWGFDYQFADDQERWASSSQALPDFLKQVPELYAVFAAETGFVKSVLRWGKRKFSPAAKTV